MLLLEFRSEKNGKEKILEVACSMLDLTQENIMNQGIEKKKYFRQFLFLKKSPASLVWNSCSSSPTSYKSIAQKNERPQSRLEEASNDF